MFQAQRAQFAGLLERFDERWPGARRRAGGLGLSLAIELGIILLLLTLGETVHKQANMGEALVTFDVSGDKGAKPKIPEKAKAETRKPAVAQSIQKPAEITPVPVPVPTNTPAAIIPLTRSQMAGFDIATMPKAKPRSTNDDMMGPAFASVPGDSVRVGNAPNGQPMYAASWYRKPYDSELRGYLSTASGPGWATINCQTEPEYRVDHCILEDEEPSGSGIGRAVLAAAWQFKVRPPQVGGVSQVGDWVRIHITYEYKPPAPVGGAQ
ncbi:hypothetical protein [Tsuneonella mangrovi]|uniref:hypothetical protein n=1 Tax=Tsuneonella mangrovi TaxID=1982042 RepID=UPI000BA1C497|nr:hypothetical protein [Tsuneonella mangrovi]